MAKRNSASGLTVLLQLGYTVLLLVMAAEQARKERFEGNGLIWLAAWIGGQLAICWLIDGRKS